jgi:glycolate oxidase iron-sulfur subunit
MELQPELARAVRARKLDAIEASGAEVVATPNPGCLLWLERGARERGLRVEVVHPVSLLARAWGA